MLIQLDKKEHKDPTVWHLHFCFKPIIFQHHITHRKYLAWLRKIYRREVYSKINNDSFWEYTTFLP